METFTIQDILINSTDLSRILCNMGIRNISECENGRNQSLEDKDIDRTVRIFLYSLIFLLSLLGNSLIIAVLVRNRRMRTVTNLFLLSLAVSDLMVSLVCIPFTLIPNLMQNFIFGIGMCKLVMYFMGVAVSVSTFNLVAISLERYSAICNPLTSRVWQTKSHAAKVITITWVASFILMLPYAIFSTLQPFTRKNNSGNMCRLVMPNNISFQAWYVSLLLVLFLIPGIIMMTAYGLISLELYRGIKYELPKRKSSRDRQSSTGSIKPGDSDGCYLQPSKRKSLTLGSGSFGNSSGKAAVGRVSCSSSASNLMAKKRVIRMLLVIVVLFFICWTPIFVVNAWKAFDQESAKRHLTGAPISFIHLLSYTSACVNPIIYCFMNKRFRQGMLATFTCCGCFRKRSERSSSLGRSAGSRTIREEGNRWRPGPNSPEENGHTPPSGASTRFTYNWQP
ncbi:hypothetical protein OJAV_G00181410 [Oryzias javanicus]|uniref:Gastrin/cholecystokinin type B receptor n=1 Tax=Oryzias javanicus TaxID=123683 RepID=A0A3S2M5J5_ORYJA|nr:hypothetical protein OJAV_G00181410 [Oryzias javanicus]